MAKVKGTKKRTRAKHKNQEVKEEEGLKNREFDRL